MTRTWAGRDVRWLLLWLAGLGLAGIWNAAFLNRPALALILTGFLNTFAVAGMVLLFCLALGWATAVIPGSTIAIHGTSSKPTSEISCGNRSPSARRTCQAWSASVSLAAKTAVGLSSRSRVVIRAPASGAWMGIGRINRGSTETPSSSCASM